MLPKHLKTHIEEWHPKEFEQDYPLTPRQMLNKAVKSEDHNYSRDLLDSREIVSGGGFGVGKGKK